MKDAERLKSGCRLARCVLLLGVAALAHGAAERQQPPPGERYAVEVPDTLDLADRAAISLHVLTEGLDPNYDYEMYTLVDYHTNPPFMAHGSGGMPNLNPKWAESDPMMRIMSGSDFNLDIDWKMMNAMLERIGPDGLYYEIYKPRTAAWTKTREDYANMFAQPRMLLAMLAWYRRDHDPAWLGRIEKMVAGIDHAAIPKQDYVYYPAVQIAPIDQFHYTRSGWKSTAEPVGGNATTSTANFVPSSTMNYALFTLGTTVRGLTQVYNTTGDKRSLELAGKMVKNLMRPTFWQEFDKDRNKGVRTPENMAADFVGHAHCSLAGIRGILDYAAATNDTSLLEFCRVTYEYIRSVGIPRIGWFASWIPPWTHTGGPIHYQDIEPCTVADMIGMAIRLTDAGVGDYWEDVDQAVRNELVELQDVDPELMRRASLPGPKHEAQAPLECSDRILQRTLGSFAGSNKVTSLGYHVEHCCTGNCTQALYYAWEGIVRCKHDVARVNLLLNRASPWLDVDSYLPYEGKVVIKNKRARTLFVRIPLWADKKAVSASINGAKVPSVLDGNYLVFDNLEKQAVVAIEFPMLQETAKFELNGQEFTCQFKGNTLVQITPDKTRLVDKQNDGDPEYVIYQRDRYKENKAPLVRKTRFVANTIITW